MQFVWLHINATTLPEQVNEFGKLNSIILKTVLKVPKAATCFVFFF